MAKLSDIINNEKESRKPAADEGATRLMELEESSVKDKQVTIRINSGLYRKYEKVCKKLGSTCNGMMTMLVTKFVSENKDLFD